MSYHDHHCQTNVIYYVHSSTISLYEMESIVSLPKDQSSTIFSNKFLMEGIATGYIIRVAECVIFPFNIVHSRVEELPRSDRPLNGMDRI